MKVERTMEKENTIGTVKNRGKELFLDIFYDIAGSLFMAIGIFCFMETADIAPGGVSGVSIMIKYLFGVPVGFAVIILVSLVTPAPRRETQDLVEHVRYPNLKAA